MIFDESVLMANSIRLRGAKIAKRDFLSQLDSAQTGDLVYLDPPYLPLSSSSSFSKYSKLDFDISDHESLATCINSLTKRGVFVVLSNSDTSDTRRIFGEYVSKYDFKRSIEDGATVPLYYENRGEKLKLDNPLINEQIREAIENEDLDSDQQDKLKRLFSREYPILTAEKRLRAIAKDVVSHFNGRGYKGKAMFVAMDKITAVKMYDLITEEWQVYCEHKLWLNGKGVLLP